MTKRATGQYLWKRLLTPIKMVVGSGNSCFISTKIWVTLGITYAMRKTTTPTPTISIKSGYARVDRIFRCKSNCCSPKSASLSTTNSKVPDVSPALIMAVYIDGNTAGCSIKALARLIPSLTRSRTCERTLRKPGRLTCSSTPLRAETRGNPAESRVASCRVVLTNSALRTLCRGSLNCSRLGFSLISSACVSSK